LNTSETRLGTKHFFEGTRVLELEGEVPLFERCQFRLLFFELLFESANLLLSFRQFFVHGTGLGSLRDLGARRF
jgi:hypothetical protein